MEDGEKKYIRAPRDDDSMKTVEWELLHLKRSWVQTHWYIGMWVPLACHVGFFYFVVLQIIYVETSFL